MHHNLLSNFLLYSTTLPSQDWFRVLSHLNTMPISTLTPYIFDYLQYGCDNEVEVKINFKKKVIKHEFQFIVIRNEQLAFIENRQKNGRVGSQEGCMALCHPLFTDQLINSFILTGEKRLIHSIKIELQGIHWQNYHIFYTQLPNKQILLLVQEIHAVVTFDKSNMSVQIHQRIANFFYPIVHQFFGIKQALDKIDSYSKVIRETLDSHKEMIRISSEPHPTNIHEKLVEVDFNLAFFWALNGAFKRLSS